MLYRIWMLTSKGNAGLLISLSSDSRLHLPWQAVPGLQSAYEFCKVGNYPIYLWDNFPLRYYL